MLGDNASHQPGWGHVEGRIGSGGGVGGGLHPLWSLHLIGSPLLDRNLIARADREDKRARGRSHKEGNPVGFCQHRQAVIDQTLQKSAKWTGIMPVDFGKMALTQDEIKAHNVMKYDPAEAKDLFGAAGGKPGGSAVPRRAPRSTVRRPGERPVPDCLRRSSGPKSS